MREGNDLGSVFAVIKPDFNVDTVDVTDTVFADLDQHYDKFAGHQLVAAFSFDADWPTWEIHPHGDEIVCLLTGDATMILKTADGEQRVRLNEPGAYVVVPKGTWHTSKVHAPTTMLFVTPGQDTENRETPGDVNG